LTKAGLLRKVLISNSRYYEYTCGMGDVVRMMDIPSPKMTEDDLIAEKNLQG